MSKEEMKNKISMALKDPILQQGFEIICKENAELKARINAINLLTPELEKSSKLKKQQLTQAKEIIKELLDLGVFGIFKGTTSEEVVHKAEQFLKEIQN